MITLLTTSHLITLELIKSSRDGVRKAREAYLIERGKTLEPLGMNKVFTSSICFLFIYYFYISNFFPITTLTAFVFNVHFFLILIFTHYYSIKLHAILYFKLKRLSLTSSLCERP